MGAFLHVKVRDPPKGGGPYIHIGLGLDLPCAAHHGNDIFADDLAGDHFGKAGLGACHHQTDAGRHHHNDPKDQQYSFRSHRHTFGNIFSVGLHRVGCVELKIRKPHRKSSSSP